MITSGTSIAMSFQVPIPAARPSNIQLRARSPPGRQPMRVASDRQTATRMMVSAYP